MRALRSGFRIVLKGDFSLFQTLEKHLVYPDLRIIQDPDIRAFPDRKRTDDELAQLLERIAFPVILQPGQQFRTLILKRSFDPFLIQRTAGPDGQYNISLGSFA